MCQYRYPSSPQGEPGPQGETGDTGPRGLTGSPGPQGEPGADGTVGPGSRGATGASGLTGAFGSSGLMVRQAPQAPQAQPAQPVLLERPGRQAVRASATTLWISTNSKMPWRLMLVPQSRREMRRHSLSSTARQPGRLLISLRPAIS